MTIEETYKLFNPVWEDIQSDDSFPNRRPLLAHYTSIETLERVMKSNEIWLSNPLYMNDLEELRFGINEGLIAFKNHPAIKKACGSDKRHEILVSEYSRQYDTYSNEHAFDTYVFCLSEYKSEKPDGSLSMWRGYGSNGSGAAIVIDTSKINAIDGSPLIISHVIYASQDERRAWINSKFDEFSKILSGADLTYEQLGVAAYAIFNRIKISAIFTKHIGFEEEREWRIVYLREFDQQKRLDDMLHYAVSSRGVEPKLKLKIQTIPDLTGAGLSLEQVVHKIILGPSSSSLLAMKSTKRMLEKIGRPDISNRLFASGIPFRPT